MVAFMNQGALFKDAAVASGARPATAHEWVARGEGTDPDRPPTPQYEAFARDIRQASAAAIVFASTELFRRKPDKWLARRDPASWGPNGHARHDPLDEQDA